jgi:hypothetical protein
MDGVRARDAPLAAAPSEREDALGAALGGYTTTPRSQGFNFDTFPLIMRRAS